MIDTATIKAHYANMLDTQLLAIAKNDGHSLTPEAFEILQEEFKKRNLDSGLIEAAVEHKEAIHQERIQQFKDHASKEFLDTVWNYVIAEKENGTPDSEILTGLKERGVEDAEASEIISGIENKLKEIIAGKSGKMLIGGGIFIAGIFITFLSYSSAAVSGGSYFVTYGAIVFGAIRFLQGLSEKGKYQRLLKTITA